MTLRKRSARLSAILWLLLSCLCCGVNAQVALYDNLDPLRDPDPEAHRWRSWPEHTPEWTVQPFLTGDSDNVSSVTIDFQPKGNPAGELAIEIWDDNGSDRPGNVVGTVGSLDLASLDGHGFPKGGEWVFMTFDNPVVGLSPDSTYYVVLNTTDTVIATNNTVANGFNSSDEGTFGAGWATGGPADGWAPLRNILNSSNFTYLNMAVTATAGRLPGDFDQDGILAANDIDLLSAQLRDPPGDLVFDLNNDAMLTNADREIWVQDLVGTSFGDADLNGEVAFSDFLPLADHFGQEGGWGDGDFDGDGHIEFPDFLALAANFGQTSAEAAAVPEPAASSLMMFAILGLIGFRRRHGR